MLRIRPALPADVGTILELIRGLAEYEREPQAAEATAEDLLRDGFGPEPKFRCLLAECEGATVGFALYFYNYSTWKGRPGIYLEDIFVWPQYRGRGIGKALFVELARIATLEGCGRYEWQVLDWNTPAIEFYQSLGAKQMKQWLPMRLEGAALDALAAQERK